MTIKKCGAIASFLLPVALIGAQFVYLTGNLRGSYGPFSYDLADILYGPVLAASIILMTYALRERIGNRANRRMDLALIAAALSALGMAATAFIRASNRHYHLAHPELMLENSVVVLTVWTTLVSGITALGFYFLGWVFMLTGSSVWTTREFSRVLSVIYFVAGIPALFVYLRPELEGFVCLYTIIIGIWQGILLWKDQVQKA
jgi:hypothetical protein